LGDVSDDDLMRLYRDGDADAFDALFDRHYGVVYRFARTMLGNDAAAEEVLQETFLAVARAADRYDPRGQFRTWLLRIVRNRCLNRIESERTRRAMTQATGLEAATSDGPAPPERMESDERLARVRAALATLPDRQREALALYAFEQMKYRDVAAAMTMPVNSVKTLIHRARAALAATLEDMNRDL
jgi:RNA polymerase sigma-70 factor, ECF subfamily